MPYYYSYGDFLANNIYCVLLVPVLLLSLWAQLQVSGSFRKYSRSPNSRRLTGARAAEAVLRSHGVYNVMVRPCQGSLTDHFDPRSGVIYLSEPVYAASTVAAVGVAAHEAGHAVQHATGYGPIRLRSAIVPLTNVGSRCSVVLLLIGMLLYSQSLFFIGILLFSLTTVFQLVTLPVEFDASRRALAAIKSQGLLDGGELKGARKVLRAAAMTYVAALLMSTLQLLRYVLIFLGRSGRNSRNGGGRR